MLLFDCVQDFIWKLALDESALVQYGVLGVNAVLPTTSCYKKWSERLDNLTPQTKFDVAVRSRRAELCSKVLISFLAEFCWTELALQRCLPYRLAAILHADDAVARAASQSIKRQLERKAKLEGHHEWMRA